MSGRITRRTVLAGLGASVGFAGLAACGGPPVAPSPASAPPAAPSPSRPGLAVWSLDGSPEIQTYLSDVVRAVAGEGGFTSSVEFYPYELLRLKEDSAAAAGTLPDLSLTYFATDWAQQGRARDVDALYQEIGRAGGGWYPVADALSQHEGRRVSLLLTIDVIPLFVRTDLFAAAGVQLPFASFEALVAGCKKVTAGSVYGFGGQFGTGAWETLLNVFFAHGGRLFAKDGAPTITTPRNLAGVTAYAELVTKHRVMPPDVGEWNETRLRLAYQSGQVAAAGSGPLLLQALRQDQPDMLAKTRLTPWPSATGGPPVAAATGLQLVINQASAHPEPAMRVARALLSRERYAGLAAAADPFVYSPLTGYDDLDTFTKDAWKQQIQRDVIPQAISVYADGGRTPVLDAIGPEIDAQLRRMVVDGTSPPQALAVIEQKAKEEAAKLKRR